MASGWDLVAEPRVRASNSSVDLWTWYSSMTTNDGLRPCWSPASAETTRKVPPLRWHRTSFRYTWQTEERSSLAWIMRRTSSNTRRAC